MKPWRVKLYIGHKNRIQYLWSFLWVPSCPTCHSPPALSLILGSQPPPTTQGAEALLSGVGMEPATDGGRGGHCLDPSVSTPAFIMDREGWMQSLRHPFLAGSQWWPCEKQPPPMKSQEGAPKRTSWLSGGKILGCQWEGNAQNVSHYSSHSIPSPWSTSGWILSVYTVLLVLFRVGYALYLQYQCSGYSWCINLPDLL